MDVIAHHAADRLLTVGRGHPYSREALFQLTAGLEGFDVCHVEQPVAQRLVGVQTAAEFSAMLCYDMPGVDFTVEDAPRAIEPDAAFVANFHAMLEAGIGMVFLHHALAAWRCARAKSASDAEIGGDAWSTTSAVSPAETAPTTTNANA